MAAYESDDPQKQLRLGQWFFNRFIRYQPLKSPYNFDMLYNSTDIGEVMDIIEHMYNDYQWEV
jgi:hypothetical protein